MNMDLSDLFPDHGTLQSYKENAKKLAGPLDSLLNSLAKRDAFVPGSGRFDDDGNRVSIYAELRVYPGIELELTANLATDLENKPGRRFGIAITAFAKAERPLRTEFMDAVRYSYSGRDIIEQVFNLTYDSGLLDKNSRSFSTLYGDGGAIHGITTDSIDGLARCAYVLLNAMDPKQRRLLDVTKAGLVATEFQRRPANTEPLQPQ
jgi:hypothetical protein